MNGWEKNKLILKERKKESENGGGVLILYFGKKYDFGKRASGKIYSLG